ncbi:MAG TPA: fumarylacetoacetate hydrolase family protein [Acidobacteriaceae bacterium]|nr:fumarylacetoacetate hydrolase family protein [Acidobacteriaceae bacterium]
MILYKIADFSPSPARSVLALEHEGRFYDVPESSLTVLMLAHEDLYGYLRSLTAGPERARIPESKDYQAPVENQEVWAAGVTYLRSRVARMEESEQASNFYDRVYSAERPELFFKSLPWKVVGPNAPVAIRQDATWSVPEPELVLAISSRGRIVGYTIGNDMSSRDIEGENPLYLPQAKIYDRSCAIGPGILVRNEPLSPATRITLEIQRGSERVFAGDTALAEMKRKPQELVEYLCRDQTFSAGAFLFTGTGIVPPDSFTLHHGDIIRIAIDGIGTLVNPVG